jgi:hypothetical protein
MVHIRRNWSSITFKSDILMATSVNSCWPLVFVIHCSFDLKYFSTLYLFCIMLMKLFVRAMIRNAPYENVHGIYLASYSS